MQNLKRWYSRLIRSKTIHAANLIALIGVVQANSDFLSTVMTPAQFGWLMVGISVAMVILRMKTTTSLKDK